MTEIHFYTTLEAEIWYATYIQKNKMIFVWLLGFVWAKFGFSSPTRLAQQFEVGFSNGKMANGNMKMRGGAYWTSRLRS